MADVNITNPDDLDLLKSAFRYLRLLSKMYFRQKVENYHTDGDPIFKAIYRYEKFWLPLLVENPADMSLQPPWDVHYVWCLHMLASSHYSQYCHAKYNRLIPHNFSHDQIAEDRGQQRAKDIWNESFLDENFENNSLSADEAFKFKSIGELKEIVLESEKKQAGLCYQVSLSHFSDSKFMMDAVMRYRLFQDLNKENSTIELYPAFDIRVILQAQALNPVKYEEDLLQIYGSSIDFPLIDYTFVNQTAVALTRRLWTTKYKTRYDVEGVSYRGMSNEIQFTKPKQTHLNVSGPENIMISVDNVKISDLWSHDQQIIVEGRLLRKTSYSYQVLFRITGKADVSLSTKSQPVAFNLRENRGIELHTYGIKGSMCMKSEEHLTTTFFDPRKLYEEDEKVVNRESVVEVPRELFGDPAVSFLCSIKVVHKTKPHRFTLHREPFLPSRIPADLVPFIQISSWNEVHGSAHINSIYSARHSVYTPGEVGSQFACHMVCTPDLDLGAILMYEDERNLVTVAYTIRDDQLPLPEQVSDGYPMSLDRILDQYAMLIRNHKGDWGVCIVRKHHQLDDVVIFAFENLQKRNITQTTFMFHENTVLKIDNMSVDLYSGTMTLSADCEEAAEYVTLAYVIGLLYVLIKGQKASTGKGSSQRLHVNTKSAKSKSEVDGKVSSRKKKSEKKSKKYEVTTTQLGPRLPSSVTLSNIKSRRKRKTLICTMLLACGLQVKYTHYEGNMIPKSFNPEASLISPMASNQELENTPHQWNGNSRQPEPIYQNGTGFILQSATSNDQFAFKKPVVTPLETETIKTDAQKRSRLKSDSYSDKQVEYLAMLDAVLDESFDQGVYLVNGGFEHDFEVGEGRSRASASYDAVDSNTLGLMNVDLDNRAQEIVSQAMSGKISKPENPTWNFISEGDDIVQHYDMVEPAKEDYSEEESYSTKL